MIKDYEKGNEKVKAIQYDGTNFNEISSWLGSNASHIADNIILEYDEYSEETVRKGDYIVRKKGNFDPFVCSAKEFEELYKELKQ